METDAAQYLQGMAYHEAGHAVVAWSLHVRVGNIHIRKIGVGNGGAEIGCADRLPLTDQLAAVAAGNEAEQIFKSPLPDHASDGDRVMAINLVLKLLGRIASDEIQVQLTAGHARARELLVEHRDKVVRVAERLREAHHVNACEFLRSMNAGVTSELH
jgi:ATP-dependent Zn protease